MQLPTLKIGKLEAKLPLVQGGMAIRLSLSKLAGAVAREGGIGLIAATALPMDELRREIRAARQLAPQGIIGINIMVAASSFAETVKTAIEEKIDLVVAGAGFSRDVFDWCKAAATEFVPIVSSAKLARIAERLGASAVIVEGAEAGGHLGTERPVKDIVPEVLDTVRIPVIGAGAIVNGYDVAAMLRLGAHGVQIGSRFAASTESAASAAMKAAYVNATKPEDIVLIQSTVGLPAQAIRNPFSEAIINDTVPRPKVCTNCLKHCTRRFCLSQALIRAQQGDGETGLIFAGSNMLRIPSVLPVKDIVQRMVQEAQAVRSYLPWRELLPARPRRLGKLRSMPIRQIAVARVALTWEDTRQALAERREELKDTRAHMRETQRVLAAKRAAVWQRIRTRIGTWKRTVAAGEKALGTIG